MLKVENSGILKIDDTGQNSASPFLGLMASSTEEGAMAKRTAACGTQPWLQLPRLPGTLESRICFMDGSAGRGSQVKPEFDPWIPQRTPTRTNCPMCTMPREWLHTTINK